ncbi:MAG: hypothetical protein PVF67_11880, partial [Anaerolineae bacterium]
SSARWTALGKAFGIESRARAADAARWAALGTLHAPDYEAIAAASSARWTALGESYTSASPRGD